MTCNKNREGDKCDPKKGTYETKEPEAKECHYSCKTCKGPKKDDCLSCSEANNRELVID